MKLIISAKRLSKSFTLIELLLYMAILSIVSMSLILYATNIIESSAKSSNQQSLSSVSRFISEKINYEIRNAYDIDFTNSNFDVNLATDQTKKLTLTVPSPNNPEIFDIVSGQLRIKLGSASPIVLNPTTVSISNLTFTNYSSVDNKTKHIGYTLTIQLNYNSARSEFNQSQTIQSSAELRSN